MIDRMHCFTDEEKIRIHDASAAVLERMGVVFQDEGVDTLVQGFGLSEYQRCLQRLGIPIGDQES